MGNDDLESTAQSTALSPAAASRSREVGLAPDELKLPWRVASDEPEEDCIVVNSDDEFVATCNSPADAAVIILAMNSRLNHAAAASPQEGSSLEGNGVTAARPGRSLATSSRSEVIAEREACANLLVAKSHEEDEYAELASATGEHEKAGNARRRAETYYVAAAHILGRAWPQPAAAAEPPCGAGVKSNPPSDIEELEKKWRRRGLACVKTNNHEFAAECFDTADSLRSLASERDQLREAVESAHGQFRDIRMLIPCCNYEETVRKIADRAVVQMHRALVRARSLLPQEGK